MINVHYYYYQPNALPLGQTGSHFFLVLAITKCPCRTLRAVIVQYLGRCGSPRTSDRLKQPQSATLRAGNTGSSVCVSPLASTAHCSQCACTLHRQPSFDPQVSNFLCQRQWWRVHEHNNIDRRSPFRSLPSDDVARCELSYLGMAYM